MKKFKMESGMNDVSLAGADVDARERYDNEYKNFSGILHKD